MLKIDLKQTTKMLTSIDVNPLFGNHHIIEVVKKTDDIEHVEIVMWGGHEREEKSND